MAAFARPPEGEALRGAVVILGGSGGNLSVRDATAFAQAGAGVPRDRPGRSPVSPCPSCPFNPSAVFAEPTCYALTDWQSAVYLLSG